MTLRIISGFEQLFSSIGWHCVAAKRRKKVVHAVTNGF